MQQRERRDEDVRSLNGFSVAWRLRPPSAPVERRLPVSDSIGAAIRMAEIAARWIHRLGAAPGDQKLKGGRADATAVKGSPLLRTSPQWRPTGWRRRESE